MLEDILIPLAFFACIPLSIWAVTFYRFKSRARLADAVQKIAESGAQPDPELIKAIGMPGKSAHSDLRSGLVRKFTPQTPDVFAPFDTVTTAMTASVSGAVTLWVCAAMITGFTIWLAKDVLDGQI